MLRVLALESLGVAEMLHVLSLRGWLLTTCWCMSCQWRFMHMMFALCTHLQYLHPADSHLPDGVLLTQLKYASISVHTGMDAGPCMLAVRKTGMQDHVIQCRGRNRCSNLRVSAFC